MNNLELAKKALYRITHHTEFADDDRNLVIIHSLVHIADVLEEIVGILKQGTHIEQKVGVIERDANVVGVKIDSIG